MKQTWKAAADLQIGDTVQLTGTKKKRMILTVTHLNGITEVTIRDLKFAINSVVVVAVYS